MAIHIFEAGSSLIENTVGKMDSNLTSMVLVTSAFVLSLGYFSKLIFKHFQSCDKDVVSCKYINTNIHVNVKYFFHAMYVVRNTAKQPVVLLHNCRTGEAPSKCLLVNISEYVFILILHILCLRNALQSFHPVFPSWVTL